MPSIAKKKKKNKLSYLCLTYNWRVNIKILILESGSAEEVFSHPLYIGLEIGAYILDWKRKRQKKKRLKNRLKNVGFYWFKNHSKNLFLYFQGWRKLKMKENFLINTTNGLKSEGQRMD